MKIIHMKKINIVLITLVFAMICGNIKAQTTMGNWSDPANATPMVPGNGTATSPYLISTPGELARLAIMVRDGSLLPTTTQVQLTADIDLLDHYWDLPIGASSTLPFRGTFDGKDFKILNLYSNNNNSVISGIFGYTDLANIKNLNLCRSDRAYYGVCDIQGRTIGSFIANAYRTTLENCYATKEIRLLNCRDYAGGLI